MNIAFVPVRSGSKGIPKKNIINLYGKPLVYWVLSALENSKKIDQVYLATDCDEIENTVRNFNLTKIQIFRRSAENASDTSSTEDVILEFLESKDFSDNDYFILAQATSPLTTSMDFDNSIQQIQDDHADSLLSCVDTKDFFWKENIPINYDYINRPRRQDHEGLLRENGAIYINKIKNIKKFKNRLYGNISIYKMKDHQAIEIDEPLDLLIAEKILEQTQKPTAKIKEIKLFLSDVDGTLTDAGMYYGEDGSELKKFNTHDGYGFELLRKKGIKTGIITSEKTALVEKRSKKLKADYLFQSRKNQGKLESAMLICKKEGININDVAYIGDDLNCLELLQNVGLAACPANAQADIKNIPGIFITKNHGGNGAVREFINFILSDNK